MQGVYYFSKGDLAVGGWCRLLSMGPAMDGFLPTLVCPVVAVNVVWLWDATQSLRKIIDVGR